MSGELVQTTFDFSLVCEEHRLEARVNTELINADAQRLAGQMVDLGKKLIRQQEILSEGNNRKHGLFEDWITNGCILSRTVVFRAMATAKKHQGLIEKVPHCGTFSASVIDELLSASDNVIEQVTSDNNIPTREEVREAKRIEREALEKAKKAEEAERQARTEIQTAQQQFTLFSQLSQEKIDGLTKHIEDLQKRIETISKPDTVEVTPQSVLDSIADMKAQITKLTEQKKLLSDEATKLAEDLKKQRKDNEAKQKQERYEAQVKDRWKKATDDIFKSLSQFNGQLPSSIDLQVFDGEEWARHTKIEEALRYALEMHLKLKEARFSQTIDDRVYETSLMEIGRE